MDVERSEHDGGDGGLRFDIERDLLCTADADGYFQSLNAAWERVLGWSREELMQRPLIEFVHPDDVERTVEEASRIVQPDSHIVNFENRFRTKDGGWRWLRWSARSDGQTWFSVGFDVTREKEAEQRLRGALTEDRLIAYSQPIVDPRLDQVVQEELLARLRAPGNGEIVGADEFLPQAERYGLIGIVDRWIATEAVAVARRGRPGGGNLSARSIADEQQCKTLERELRAAGPSGGRIMFEIPEPAGVENIDAARELT